MKTIRKSYVWDDRQLHVLVDYKKRKMPARPVNKFRICPYTLELLEDCPVRGASLKKVCSFALEACSI